MFSPSEDWLPAISITSEDIIDSGEDSEETDKETNLDQVANSNMILLSGGNEKKESCKFLGKYNRSSVKKKQMTTEF